MKGKGEIAMKGLGLCFLCGLILLDQLTKKMAVRHLRFQPGISLIDGVLELSYVENTGVAFGLFPDGRVFLIILSAIALLFFLTLYFFSSKSSCGLPFYAALLLLSAGTAGNLIDRIRLGYVVDFIYVSLIHFPVFNVADSCICVGVFLLFIMAFWEKDRGED